MATLPVQTVTATGTTPDYDAASPTGDKVRPGGRVVLHFRNAGLDPVTVTLVTPGTVQGLAIADRTVTVPAAGDVLVTVSADLYADPADSGLASFTYSATTDVTVAALRV